MIDDLASHHDDLAAEIDEYETRQQAVEAYQSEKTEIKHQLQDERDTLQRERTQLSDTLEPQISMLKSEISQLKDSLPDQALTDEHQTISEQIGEVRSTLADLEEEQEALASRADVRSRLKDTRDRLLTELEELQDRRNARIVAIMEEFDRAIHDLATTFAPSFEDATLVEQYEADDSTKITGISLEITRDGTHLTSDELSEGERELVGLMLALAGYRAYDVADTVPLLLLDELGSLAKTHLENLATYVRGETTHVVMTAFPEAGSFNANTLDPGEWATVSDDRAAPEV